MNRLLPALIVLLSLPRFVLAADIFRMPAELPPLDKRDNWQQSLDELDAQNIPTSWLLIGPIADKESKFFDLPEGMKPDQTDNWADQKTISWSRPREDDGCLMDLAEPFNVRTEVLGYAQTEIEWPVDGPALFWFEYYGRAMVYLNNQRIFPPGPPPKHKEERKEAERKEFEPTKYTMAPIPLQMKRGKNILKIKIGQERKPKYKGLGFFCRLERNDLPYRLALYEKLKALYPQEAAGWRGTEMLLEFARDYEAAAAPDKAAAMYQQAALSTDDDLRLEAQRDRQRLLDGAKAESSEQIWQNWKKVDEQFKALLRDADTLGADSLMRDYLAKYPLHESAGNALIFRGGLRLDYSFDSSCQPYLERALREFSRNDFVRKFSIRGLAFARTNRVDKPVVQTNREVQVVVDAARRQMSDGDAADISAAMRSLSSVLEKSPGTLLQISDSATFPRYVGIHEYFRALLAHLSGQPLAQYRKTMESAASARLADALKLRSIAELESVVAQYYFTTSAAEALNQIGNLYLDRGAWPQALHAFKTLQRDYNGVRAISDAALSAKIARTLALDGQADAARAAAKKLAADFGAEKIIARGETISGADFARSLEAWLGKGVAAPGPIERSFAETYASNSRRSGPPANAPSPRPGAQAWAQPATPSKSSIAAKNFWPEDTLFSHLQSYPVVSGNRLFISTQESIECFDLASGKNLWRQTWDSLGSLFPMRDNNLLFTGFPLSCPTVAGDRVFLRTTKGSQTALRSYSAADGTLAWTTEQIPGLKKTVWLSDPVVANGLAIAVFLEVPAELGLEPGQSTVNAHGVAAFDAESGQLRWKRELTSGAMPRVVERISGHDSKSYATYRSCMQLGPPAVDGGTVYAATGLGSLAALNVFTGDVIWLAGYPQLHSESLESGNSAIDKFLPRMLKILSRGPASPIVGEDVVLLAPKDAPGIFAFERQNGQLRWVNELNDARFLAGICNGNLLAVDDRVQAISLATGTTSWEYTLQGKSKKLFAHPGFSGSTLYLPNADGLELLDASSGKFIRACPWDAKTGPVGNLTVAGAMLVGVNAKWIAAFTSSGNAAAKP